MPILDRPWTKADFDSAYVLVGEPKGHKAGRMGVRLHYHRFSVIKTLDRRWRDLTKKLGNPQRVAVIGAGFGWGSECLEKHATQCQVIGTDTSPYIQAEKDKTEELDLIDRLLEVGLEPTSGDGLACMQRWFDGGPRARTPVEDENLVGQQSRTRLRQTLGVPSFDFVISEDVMACLSDAGAVALAQNMDRMNPSSDIVHTIAPRVVTKPEDILALGRERQHPGYNWKWLEEWRALLDANGCASHKIIRAQIKKEDWVTDGSPTDTHR